MPLSSYSLSVIPMFTWMGFLAYYSGIGTKLYRLAYKVLGHLPGGLAVATQAACGMFGAVCGSNTATAATIGAIALPEMRKYNYDDSLSTASVAAGGARGFDPAQCDLYCLRDRHRAIHRPALPGRDSSRSSSWPPTCSPSISGRPAGRNWDRPGRGRPGGNGWRARGGVLEVMIIFAISLGGLITGWFTPTEAGAVGAAGVLLVSLVQQRLSWEGFLKSLADTTRTSAMIMLLVAGAIVFGRFIALSRLPFAMAGWAEAWRCHPFDHPAHPLDSPYFRLLHRCPGFNPLDDPHLLPGGRRDPGLRSHMVRRIIVLVVAMGVITPPVGMNVYIIKGVAKDIPLETIFKGIWPFLAALAVCFLLLIAFPQIATFLPSLLMGG